MERCEVECIDDWNHIDGYMSSSQDLPDGVDVGTTYPGALTTDGTHGDAQSDSGEGAQLHLIDTESTDTADEVKRSEGTGVVLDSRRNSQQAWSWQSSWCALSSAVKQDVTEASESLRHALEPPWHKVSQPGGVSDANVDAPADDKILKGFQAIDKQVDTVAKATGAVLGDLWSGIGTAISTGLQAASQAVEHVESAAQHVVSLAAQQSAPTSNAFLTSFGARTVEGTLVLNGQSAGDDWQMVDLLGSPATSVTISFEQLFKLFRGERFTGELEALGCNAAKACNRTHRDLPMNVRKDLDRAIATVAAAVDLIASLAPGADPLAAIENLQISSLEPSSSPSTPPPEGPMAALTSLSSAAVQRAQDMHATISFDSHQRLWETLCRLRAEGLKLLAEYTALCIQHLAFLAMCVDGGDMAAAGIDCAKDISSGSAAVRKVLLRLLIGVTTVYKAFHGALDATTSSPDFLQLQQAPEGAAVDVGGTPVMIRELNVVAGELKHGLRVGACSALERILQGSRHLVYPVCAPLAQALAAQYPGPYTSIPLLPSPTPTPFANPVPPASTAPAPATSHASAPQITTFLGPQDPWQDAANKRGPAGLPSIRSVASIDGSLRGDPCRPAATVADVHIAPTAGSDCATTSTVPDVLPQGSDGDAAPSNTREGLMEDVSSDGSHARISQAVAAGVESANKCQRESSAERASEDRASSPACCQDDVTASGGSTGQEKDRQGDGESSAADPQGAMFPKKGASALPRNEKLGAQVEGDFLSGSPVSSPVSSKPLITEIKSTGATCLESGDPEPFAEEIQKHAEGDTDVNGCSVCITGIRGSADALAAVADAGSSDHSEVCAAVADAGSSDHSEVCAAVADADGAELKVASEGDAGAEEGGEAATETERASPRTVVSPPSCLAPIKAREEATKSPVEGASPAIHSRSSTAASTPSTASSRNSKGKKKGRKGR